MTRTGRLGPGREFDLVRRFMSVIPAHEDVVVGAGDDAAVLRDGWIISTDASVEDVHFRREWLSAVEIGYRSAAVAISDLAAMAATPVALLVSLVLPASDYDEFAEQIMAGIARAADRYAAAVAGGDVSRTNGPLVIDVVAVGRSDSPVLRSGARAGDEVWVTGVLSGAAHALAVWRAGQSPVAHARARFATPEPRVREALWLAEHLELHALIDLSDGLVADAAHIAAASDVAIRIETAAVPTHRAESADSNEPAPAPSREPTFAVRAALAGGDDYELCFTAAADSVEPLRLEFEQTFELPLSRVGIVLAGSGVEIMDENGRRLEEVLTGYDHFGIAP